MKIIHLLATISIVIGTRAAAQDTPPPPPAMDDAMMKMIEAASPNENHKKLAQYIGTWDAVSSFWMEGPDKSPVGGKATVKFTWGFEGRFLKQEMQGYFMGMPYTGLGFNGYDNIKKTYTQFWIDNTSTSMYVAEGDFDQAGNTLTLKGTMDDPMTGEMGVPIRYVIGKVADDRFVFEMYVVPAGGAPVKSAEIIYTRATAHN